MTTQPPSGPDETPPAPGRLIVFAVLALLSIIAATASGVSLAFAANDRGIETARMRDLVLHQAEQRLVAMNTIDYRKATECLDRWQQQVTGPLSDEVTKGREGNINAIQRSRTTTTSRVLEAAVTKLDVHKGRAFVISTLTVTVAAEGAPPVTKRSRINAELSATSQGWKLSGVQVVGLSG